MSYQILGKTLPLQYVYLIIILQSTKMVASFFFVLNNSKSYTVGWYSGNEWQT